MFRAEPSPITTFEGFTVKCFRQGRVNLVERRLSHTKVIFVPSKGVVGVFLASAIEIVEEVLLRAAWQAQGSPRVAKPDAQHLYLFGERLTIEQMAFAGCNDVWREGERIIVAFRRGVCEKTQAALLSRFIYTALETHVQQLFETFRPQLKRQPQAIQIAPLRGRVLGKCTRDGVIYLNFSLSQWSLAIIEETLAHELVHLEHFNHSAAFWQRLTTLLPGWLPRYLIHYL